MDFKKYENNMIHPERPKKPMLHRNHSSQDAKDYAVDLKNWEKEFAEFKEKVSEYQKNTYKLQDQFRHDALEDVGLLGHEKEGKAYSMAWERGHSSGLHEVYQELTEVAELLL